MQEKFVRLTAAARVEAMPACKVPQGEGLLPPAARRFPAVAAQSLNAFSVLAAAVDAPCGSLYRWLLRVWLQSYTGELHTVVPVRVPNRQRLRAEGHTGVIPPHCIRMRTAENSSRQAGNWQT